MKKLITIILILALLLPASALADRDKIVGSWYVLNDYTEYPELASTSNGCDIIIMIYTFFEDGTIMCTENDIVGKTGNVQSSPTGKWEKTGDTYKYSMIGFGEGIIKFEEENSILLSFLDQGYFRMHKMICLNPYKDYVFN